METFFANLSIAGAAGSGGKLVTIELPENGELIRTLLSAALNGNFGLRLHKHRAIYVVRAILPEPSHAQQGQRLFYRIARMSPLLYAAASFTVVEAKLDTSTNTILIRDMDNWVDVAVWAMSTFPRPRDDVFGLGSPLWCTAYLWNNNGKHFKFTKLPAEVRNKIYDACADFAYPYYWMRDGARLHSSTRSMKRELQGQAPIMGLLLSNKQVSGEFKHQMFKNLEVRFMDADLFKEFADPQLRMTTTRVWPPLLSRLSLEFSVPQWAKRLDIGFPTTAVTGVCNLFCKLLDQLEISHLSLDIPHIEHVDYSSMFEPTDKGCHRVFLGMLLLHLQQHHIKRIPHVEVTGCVPEDMKATFQKLHNEELVEGGVSAVTEWDLIGDSTKLKSQNLSWIQYLSSFFRTRRSVCSILDGGEAHGCEKLFCTDHFCLSKTGFRNPT
ncbi:hypothetical protein BFW01_g8349 [Lasiodiplodia theobromae]|nr:hypothetical protein BFW01_g8349 [Lasiodiplodia theobromae]